MPIIRNTAIFIYLSVFTMGCQSENAESPIQVTSPSLQTTQAETLVELGVPKISSTASPNQQDLETCMDITNGDVLVSDLPESASSPNNFYLECTLNPFIGTVKVTQSDRDRVRAVQSKNLAYLFNQDIDAHYVTTYGSRLLHAVIVSDLDEDKKMSWVERLVKDGADINYMSEYGNEALRAAEYKNLPRIYDWLVKKGAKPKQPLKP